MATIGVLNLLCTADTSGLQKGAGKARAEVLSVASTVEQARSKMGGLLAGVGAALGVGSLVAWVKSSMDAINSTRVLGERLGTSTEALSRLQYAAKIADVDSETLAGSLSKMQKNLAEVAMTGGGKASSVLEKYGLDAATLAAQDPVATFHELLAVLEKIPNPAERMKTATDIFGKQAQGILNLAIQGSEGLAKMEADADALGITFNDMDAAKVDEADDAMTSIWETIAGVGRALAIEVAPWITHIATMFMDWFKGADVIAVIHQGITGLSSGIQRTLGFIAPLWDSLTTGLSAIGSSVSTTASMIASGLSQVPGMIDDVFGEGTIGMLVGFGTTIKDSVLDKIELLGVLWRHLPEFVEVAAIQIYEKIINLGEYLATIPENLQIIGNYVADNWRQLMWDGISSVGIAFLNLGTNVGNLFKAIQGWFAGEGWSFNWTPMLEGFKATAAKFPELVKPTLTSLQDSITDKLNDIGKAEAERAARLAAANAASVVDAANGRARQAVDAAKKFRGTGSGDEIEMNGKGTAQVKAAIMGSAEAANTILATRFGAGQGKDLPAVAGNTRRTAEAVEKMVAEIANITGLSEAEIIDNFS